MMLGSVSYNSVPVAISDESLVQQNSHVFKHVINPNEVNEILYLLKVRLMLKYLLDQGFRVKRLYIWYVFLLSRENSF